MLFYFGKPIFTYVQICCIYPLPTLHSSDIASRFETVTFFTTVINYISHIIFRNVYNLLIHNFIVLPAVAHYYYFQTGS
jgi:hypothetical protein